MIESVRCNTGPAAGLTEAWPRETGRKDEQTASAATDTDTATISQGAGQRAAWGEEAGIDSDAADEALAFVQNALSDQDISGLHDLSADRVMRLVGLLA